MGLPKYLIDYRGGCGLVWVVATAPTEDILKYIGHRWTLILPQDVYKKLKTALGKISDKGVQSKLNEKLQQAVEKNYFILSKNGLDYYNEPVKRHEERISGVWTENYKSKAFPKREWDTRFYNIVTAIIILRTSVLNKPAKYHKDAVKMLDQMYAEEWKDRWEFSPPPLKGLDELVKLQTPLS